MGNWKAVLFIIVVLAVWQTVSSLKMADPVLFPAPLIVLLAGIEWTVSGELLSDTLNSFSRLVMGLFIGASLGVAVGLLMGRIFFLEEAVAPAFHILRSFPPVAIIPLVIIWFGIGDLAKIFSIAFAVFFPVWISSFLGAKSIHADYLKVAKLFSKSALKTYSKVIIPATMPFILTGIRIGIGVAFIMVFVSELSGASSGIGYRISLTQITYQTDFMLAGLIFLGLIAATTDYLFAKSIKKFFPWVELK